MFSGKEQNIHSVPVITKKSLSKATFEKKKSPFTRYHGFRITFGDGNIKLELIKIFQDLVVEDTICVNLNAVVYFSGWGCYMDNYAEELRIQTEKEQSHVILIMGWNGIYKWENVQNGDILLWHSNTHHWNKDKIPQCRSWNKTWMGRKEPK